MSRNAGAWRISFWPDEESANNSLTFVGGNGYEGETEGCLILPPDGLGVPSQNTGDKIKVQRDGAEFYDDWFTPRQVTFSVLVAESTCQGCTRRQAVARIMKYWNRNCSSARLLLVADCTPITDTFPGDVEADPSDRAILGPYLLTGRPRAANVVHGRTNEGWSRVDFLFEAKSHKIGVVQPSTIDGLLTEWECMTLATNGASGLADHEGDTSPFPLITLTGPLTDPEISNGGSLSLQYTGTIAAGETVMIDPSARRAWLDGFPNDEDRSLLVTQWATLRVQASGTTTFTFTSASGTGTAEICWPTYVVGI